MTYTKNIESMTASIESERAKSTVSKVTNYIANTKKLDELNKQLWALDNGYTQVKAKTDPYYVAFMIVWYQWLVTMFMVIGGGGL